MTTIKPGDRVWVGHAPYEDTSHAGYATVTMVTSDGLVEVQFEPVLVSEDRVYRRSIRGV